MDAARSGLYFCVDLALFARLAGARERVYAARKPRRQALLTLAQIVCSKPIAHGQAISHSQTLLDPSAEAAHSMCAWLRRLVAC